MSSQGARGSQLSYMASSGLMTLAYTHIESMHNNTFMCTGMLFRKKAEN